MTSLDQAVSGPGIATFTSILGKRMGQAFGASHTRGSPYLGRLGFRVWGCSTTNRGLPQGRWCLGGGLGWQRLLTIGVYGRGV